MKKYEMSGDSTYDDVLLNILKEKKQIVPFLDTVFGFLYRRTDLYILKDNPDGKIGFPPGVAETVVRDTFRKWQKLMFQDKNISSMQEDMSGLIIHEEEVVTTEDFTTSEYSKDSEDLLPIQQRKEMSEREVDLSSDTYNGADCGKYRWSQTWAEVDIKVPVPSNVSKASDVQVDIQACQLSVAVRGAAGQWDTLVTGELSHKHLRDESIWTLSPGKHVSIHLQKSGEVWWDRLLSTERRLDLSQIDVSKHASELPEEDHMQVEKVISIQEERSRKQLDILKEAWNLEGSPFQGTPFDPSVMQIHP